MAINHKQLEKALKKMGPRSALFKLVKAEMVRRGHWKALPRGQGFKKGLDSRRKTLKPLD